MNEATSELSRDDLLARYGKKPNPETPKEHRSPFKFLDSYEVDDAEIFFGRDAEIEELLRHFHSDGHVLIYGESGSGKSSLVQCGLRARIPDADALFLPLRIHATGLPVLGMQICGQAMDALGEFVEVSENATLMETLRAVRDVASRPLVLFFDQFEELVIFHDPETRQRFARELAEIRTARINVKVMIGIRQDYLAQLSEFEDIVDGLFDNRFWLRRMSRENASKAVVQACTTCDVEISRDLANSILHRLDPTGQGVELPYLQVAMDRLYRQAVSSCKPSRDGAGQALNSTASPQITSADVEKLGDIANILGSFLIEEVAKLPLPEAGRQILKAFVTSEGTRRSLDRSAVAQEAAGFGEEISSDVLNTHLEQLASVRILRDVADSGTYELRHDALAKTVAGWISEVEKELLEVRDNLTNRFNEYLARERNSSALLDSSFLDYLSVYQSRLKPLIGDDVFAYIRSSQDHQEQAAKAKRRVTRIVTAIIGSVITACLIFALLEWRKSSIAQQLAEQQLHQTRQLLYVNNIGSALNDWQTNNVPSAWNHLNACPKDLRGWEFRYLESMFKRTHQTVTGHTGGVLALEVGKDGFVASGSSNGELRLGDLTDRATVESIDAHDGRLLAVAISPDNSQIATAGADKLIKVWSRSGALQNTLEGHTDAVSAVTFSPSGKLIASASHDRTLKFWDPNSGQLMRSIDAHQLAIETVAFLDGKRVVSGAADKLIKLWNVETGEELATFVGHTDYISSIAVSANGNLLVSASYDNTLRIWDVKTGETRAILKGHTDDIYDTVFSSDAATVFSAGHDKSIRQWDVETGTERTLLKGHLGPVNGLSFDLERGLIFSGSDDETIRIWDASENTTLNVLDAKSGFVMVTAFSPDGKQVVAGHYDNELSLWNIATRERIALIGHTSTVAAVVFTDTEIISASRDQTVRRWDRLTGEQRNVIRLPSAIMGQETLTSKAHTTRVAAVSFSSDGQRIVTAGPENTLLVWDVSTGKQITQLKGHQGLLSAVAFNKDGTKIVSGSVDRSVKIWNVETAECLATLEGHKDLISSVDYSPDGETVLSGSWDKTVRIWDVQSAQQLRQFRGHSDLVYHVRYSADGSRLASTGRDRALKLWDVRIDEPTIVLKGHNSGITTVSFSSDSNSMASGGYDGAVILWQTDVSNP